MRPGRKHRLMMLVLPCFFHNLFALSLLVLVRRVTEPDYAQDIVEVSVFSWGRLRQEVCRLPPSARNLQKPFKSVQLHQLAASSRKLTSDPNRIWLHRFDGVVCTSALSQPGGGGGVAAAAGVVVVLVVVWPVDLF